MITLHPLPRSAIDRVQHLVLPAAQAPYVGSIDEMTAEPDHLQEFHIADRDGEAVAFFKVDRDFSRRIDGVAQGSLGLRGLLVGGQYQGSGIGSALLCHLPDYLAQRYPRSQAIWLSVDKANDIAFTLYEKHGWQQVGPVISGRSGPEIVMRRRLTGAKDH